MIVRSKLKGSLNGNTPTINSDAWVGYPDTIDEVFGTDVNFGTVTKLYAVEPAGRGRYAPPTVAEVISKVVHGDPDRFCTSLIERNNLTVRTFQRRFTRLSLGYSRKWENLWAAVNLHFGFYNLVWQPRTLKGLSPAMAAGIVDRLWDVEDLVGDC